MKKHGPPPWGMKSEGWILSVGIMGSDASAGMIMDERPGNTLHPAINGIEASNGTTSGQYCFPNGSV
jgi:hypothetical protein